MSPTMETLKGAPVMRETYCPQEVKLCTAEYRAHLIDWFIGWFID